MDRARLKATRQEPDTALRLWRGLISGRWTLVEAIERDGKRLLFARPNAPHLPGRPMLTATERAAAGLTALGHAQKLIAYELGVSAPTVTKLIDNVLAKLGLASRSEIVAAFARSPVES
jgi:DNA-binding CsgD family transcriptional regulator